MPRNLLIVLFVIRNITPCKLPTLHFVHNLFTLLVAARDEDEDHNLGLGIPKWLERSDCRPNPESRDSSLH